MGCLQLHNYTTLRIAHTSNTARSREVKSDAGLYKYKYNGKEFQEELGLNWSDYGARNYDAALSRWMNIDPLIETSRRWSTYTYCNNNPIIYVDPDGMFSVSIEESKKEPSWEERYMQYKKTLIGGEYAIASNNNNPPKTWVGRAWNTIKKWFSSKDEYKPITSIEVGKVEIESFGDRICTIGCHSAPTGLGYFDYTNDPAGHLRNTLSEIDTVIDYSDATLELFEKGPLFGKLLSNKISNSTTALSIIADYNSDSDINEFTQNTIIGSTSTAVGLRFGPFAEIATATVLTDGTQKDGLTNLKNGRLASAYSSTYDQNRAYLISSFNQVSPEKEGANRKRDSINKIRNGK